MVQHLSSTMTNGGMKRGKGYHTRIMIWMKEEKKSCGMKFLKSLFLSVFGAEIGDFSRITGRRVKERWIDEGKGEEKGRREWERRWREAEDIMNEEDVID